MNRKNLDPFSSIFDEFFSYEKDYFPKRTVLEDDNGYTLLISIPGLTKDDISISLKDERIEIRYEDEKDNVFVKPFKLNYKVSNKIDSDNIKATIENGILKLVVPYNNRKIKEKTINID